MWIWCDQHLGLGGPYQLEIRGAAQWYQWYQLPVVGTSSAALLATSHRIMRFSRHIPEPAPDSHDLTYATPPT